MDSKKSSFLEKIKKIKGLEFIVIGIAALFVLFLAFGIKPKEKSETAEDGYVKNLEARLSSALSNVSGAGKVKVVISAVGGNTTLIATDVTTLKGANGVEVRETPVLIGGKVVVLGEKYPEISGVLIVASGADDISVKTQLIEAAATLLSLDRKKIQVLTGK